MSERLSKLCNPPWWNLLRRYQRWQLMRALRRVRETFYVPSDKVQP